MSSPIPCTMCDRIASVWAVLNSDTEVFLCVTCESKMDSYIVEVTPL